MRFRFLYLNEAGEEVEVGGLDELRSCVAMGRVDENTLLFDAVTREWAPARAHSAYRLLAQELNGPGANLRQAGSKGSAEDPAATDARDQGDEGAAPSPASAGAETEADADAPDILGELEPDPEADRLPKLTPLADPEMPDPVELFLEKQERERRREAEQSDTSAARGDIATENYRESFHLLDTRGEPAGGPPDAPADPSSTEPREAEAPAAKADSDTRAGSTSDDDDIFVPKMPRSTPPARIRRSPVGLRRRRLAAIVGVGAVLIAIVAIFGDDAAQAGPAGGEDAAPTPSATGQRGALADAVATAEGSAFDDMVQVMDSLRGTYDLLRGPEGWLDGLYLASPSSYPDVQAYWGRYQAFVDELQARDTALFRVGFVDRLRESGIEGPVLSMRLARALDDFRATQPARDSLYQGMETLAGRALALHAFLLEHEGEVEYDPVRLGTVSRDPVMEVFPSDPALRDQIWAHLDGIFEAMDVVQGGVPGSRDQITDAALREIRRTPGNR
jgi:hypothetical protein